MARVVFVLGAVLHLDADSLGLGAEVLVRLLALHLHFVGELHGVVYLVSGALVAFLARVELHVLAELLETAVIYAEVVSLRAVGEAIFLFNIEVLVHRLLLSILVALWVDLRVLHQLHIVLLSRLADLPDLVTSIDFDGLLPILWLIPSGILEDLRVVLILRVHLVLNMCRRHFLRYKLKRLSHFARLMLTLLHL